MERKPRPLTQPVLSGSQWTRIAFLGFLMAAGTLVLEDAVAPTGAVVAGTMAATVFSLLNIFAGLSARSEARSSFNRDILSDRRQLGLFGLCVLLTILATELRFLQRILGTTPLRGSQWLLCVAVAFVLLLVDEVIKLFLRRRR
jgi:Ca2+-transporting ATPase